MTEHHSCQIMVDSCEEAHLCHNGASLNLMVELHTLCLLTTDIQALEVIIYVREISKIHLRDHLEAKTMKASHDRVFGCVETKNYECIQKSSIVTV